MGRILRWNVVDCWRSAWGWPKRGVMAYERKDILVLQKHVGEVEERIISLRTFLNQYLHGRRAYNNVLWCRRRALGTKHHLN